LREGFDGGVVVENKDEVGQFEPDLAAEAGAGGGNGARRTPATIGQACDDETTAEACGAEETGFEDSENCKALQKQSFVRRSGKEMPGRAGWMWWLAHLGVYQNGGRDDLVRPECLPGIDERSQNLPTFLTFRLEMMSATRDFPKRSGMGESSGEQDLHAIDDGRGLFKPMIAGVWACL
jgi:hypothetical protein